MKLYLLVLTHDCDVNIVVSPTAHIYLGRCKAGQRLASGQRSHVEGVQRVYLRHGYGTRVVPF